MEEPPEEAGDCEVTELNPLISQVCRMDAEVTEDESRNHHCCKETDIESVNTVVYIRLILLEKSVSEGPASDTKDAINVG